MALSFGLFLTVSFHASPYFTGSDIVFFFAWTPLLLAGAAGAPALDTWLARPPAGTGVRRGRCPGGPCCPRARSPASPPVWSWSLGGLTAALGRRPGAPPTPRPAGRHPLGRRVRSGSTHHDLARRRDGAATGTTPAPTRRGPPSGRRRACPVGGSASFTDPKSGDPSLVIQQTAGDFVAFDAVCPHAGCTVAYQTSARIIACPCHGSEFNPRTGAVIRGRPPIGLTKIKVDQGAERQPLRAQVTAGRAGRRRRVAGVPVRWATIRPQSPLGAAP